MDDLNIGLDLQKTINELNLSFDTHNGIVCLVHCSEQGTPIMSSQDKTTQFIHVMQEFHKFHSSKSEDRCIKMTKANGKGVALMVTEAHWPNKSNWLEKYLEATDWVINDGAYWKNGYQLQQIDGGKIVIVDKFERTCEFNRPRNEIEAECLWHLIGLE